MDIEEIRRLKSALESLANGDYTKTISHEESALGKFENNRRSESEKQIEILKQIADSAKIQAEIAAKQAQDSEKKASEYEKKSRRSATFSAISAAGTFLMWLFTRDEAISLIREAAEPSRLACGSNIHHCF